MTDQKFVKSSPLFFIRVKEEVSGLTQFRTVAAVWENDKGQFTGRTKDGEPVTLHGTFYLVRNGKQILTSEKNDAASHFNRENKFVTQA